MAQWIARRTCDPAVAGSIPTTAHVVIALENCLQQEEEEEEEDSTPVCKMGTRQLKCIDW